MVCQRLKPVGLKLLLKTAFWTTCRTTQTVEKHLNICLKRFKAQHKY